MTEHLVIGAAPMEYVAQAVARLDGKTCVVLAKDAQVFCKQAVRTYSLQKRITCWSLQLLLILCRHRPRKIHLVVGKRFWHDNIVQAVRLQALLLNLDTRLYLIEKGISREHNPFPLFFAPLVHFLSYLLLACAVVLLCIFLNPLVVLFLVLLDGSYGLLQKCVKKRQGTTKQYCYSTNIIIYDKKLGWALSENAFGYGSIADTATGEYYDYCFEHDANGRRVTGYMKHPGQDKVAILGCSYTYASYLNDEEGYPFLLQCKNKDLNIVNYGVGGYSLLQMYLQLQEIVADPSLKAVLIGFHTGLELRTITAYARMKGPFPAWPEKKVGLDMRRHKILKPKGYCWLHGSKRSFAVHILESAINFLNLYTPHEQRKGEAQTKYILLAMRSLCQKHGVKLLMIHHPGSNKYIDFIRKNFNWCESMPTETYFHTPGYRIPLDGHPNARANAAFADAIQPALLALLQTGRYSPPVEDYWKYVKDSAEDTVEKYSIYPLH